MRFMIKQDIAVLRELVKQYAEVAALPEQAEKIRLWQKLNGLEPERPMFMIDQLPWNELEYGDELTLRCGDATCRMIETDLRRLLYRSRYLQDDFAYEPVLRVPKKIIGVDFDPTQGICFDYGISIDHDTIAGPSNPRMWRRGFWPIAACAPARAADHAGRGGERAARGDRAPRRGRHPPRVDGRLRPVVPSVGRHFYVARHGKRVL